MNYPLYTLIDFPSFVNKTGSLTVFDHKNISFEIKRVFTIQNIKKTDMRGGHTHHQTHQILICVVGQCVIDMDNGIEKKTLILNSPAQGIVLYPYVWHTMRDFKDGAILMVLANTDYDEKDYIRSYDEFLKITKKYDNSFFDAKRQFYFLQKNR